MINLIKSTFYNEAKTKAKLCKFIQNASQLSLGKQCSDFEKAFAKWQGKKYAVMFNSGSSANLALIQVLINLGKIKSGDNVGFSAVTWSTNVMPLITMKLGPVPIDIEKETLNLSLNTIKDAYKKHKFKCLFITNLLGFCGEMSEIRKFCNKNKILLIEDNCECLGTEYKGIKTGNFGLASTFSFYVGHHMSTIEGGMVCTDDREVNTMLRIVRSHGWDRHLTQEEQDKLRKKFKVDEFYGKYTFYDIGYNLRPTDIQGFLGADQLKYLNTIIKKRVKNYHQLKKIFSNKDFIELDTHNITKVSNFAFPLICKTREARNKYIELAKKAQIEIRPIVAGNINRQAFFGKHIEGSFHLPNAEFVHHNGFYFGNNPELTQKEINLIIKTFS